MKNPISNILPMVINNIHLLLSNDDTKRFTITLRDIIISFYYTIGTSVCTAAIQCLQTNNMLTMHELKLSIYAGIVVGLQHVVRKYLTGGVK